MDRPDIAPIDGLYLLRAQSVLDFILGRSGVRVHPAYIADGAPIDVTLG